MNNLKIHFVRHAPVINPRKILYDREIEYDLSCTELFQTAALQLPSPQSSMWVSSPYPRAIGTAHKLLSFDNPNVTPLIMDDFREKARGDFAGRRLRVLLEDPLFKAWTKDPYNADVPNGENENEFKERIDRGITSLLNKMVQQKQTQAVVVCHEGVIRQAHYFDKDLPENPRTLRQIKTPYVGIKTMEFERPSQSQLTAA